VTEDALFDGVVGDAERLVGLLEEGTCDEAPLVPFGLRLADGKLDIDETALGLRLVDGELDTDGKLERDRALK